MLSTPVYRDEYLIGKAIGAITTLAIALSIVLILAIAILLFYGIVPDIDNFVRMILYFITVLLYCTLFYGIAVMMSLFTKNNTISIVSSISIVLALLIAAIISPIIANMITSYIIGPAPEEIYYVANITQSSGSDMAQIQTTNAEAAANFERSRNYNEKSQSISDMITTISPVNNFNGNFDASPGGIANKLLRKEKYVLHNYIIDILPLAKSVTLGETISEIWYKVLILIAEIMGVFAIAYAKFMRMDI